MKKMKETAGDAFKPLPEFQAERGERVVWRGKPRKLAFFHLYAMGVLAIILSLVHPVLLVVTIPLCAALFAISLAIRQAYEFILTDRRARVEFRLWATRVKDIPLEAVVNVFGDQDLVGRALNYGTVRFVTPGTPYAGTKFWGVEDYPKIVSLAWGAIERARK